MKVWYVNFQQGTVRVSAAMPVVATSDEQARAFARLLNPELVSAGFIPVEATAGSYPHAPPTERK